MFSKANLLRTLSALALLINATHQHPTQVARAPATKPIWMIAHKCLDKKGVDDALSHGANAVEMDLTAYSTGWWAQHPPEQSWDAIGDLFDHIASRKAAGANIQWVWLDIKTPDGQKDGPGSIQGLQTLVREKLSSHGVAALYGFSVDHGPAIEHVRSTLADNEGINYDASSDNHSENKTPKDAIKVLQSVKKGQRIGSYGWDWLKNSFGDCVEDGFYTCTELRQAVNSGNWAKVFGWTATAEDGDTYLVSRLFHNAKVDGMIYGFHQTKYYDHADSRAAAKEVKDYIDGHQDVMHLAETSDGFPWSGAA